MTMNPSALLLLGLVASAYCGTFKAAVSAVQEQLKEDVTQLKGQVDEETKLIEKHMKQNMAALMSGDSYKAVMTLMKNYLELAKTLASHAIKNSFKYAHDWKEDFEVIKKMVANFNSETANPETGVPVESETEIPVESETDAIDESETESFLNDETETNASDETETETTDEADTKPSSKERKSGPESKRIFGFNSNMGISFSKEHSIKI